MTDSATAPNTNFESASFESALAELEKIVRDLETGKTSLEDSIKAYERGVALKNFCERKLTEAQARIDKIIVKNDGSISTVPFETDNKN